MEERKITPIERKTRLDKAFEDIENHFCGKAVLADKLKQLKIARKPIDYFMYLTPSLVLREAYKHPTNGWKTNRFKDLSKSLDGLKFTYEKLIKDLQKKHGHVIYSYTKNPIVGL